MTFEIPYDDFEPGEVANADQIDANFAALAAVIGTNLFEENNYVTDDASITSNVNALDKRLKLLGDSALASLYFTTLLPDEQDPFEDDLVRGTSVFPSAGAFGWFEIDRAPTDNLVAKINANLRMSTASASTVGFNLVYQIFGATDPRNPIKERWKPVATYSTGHDLNPDSYNGHFYTAISAGISLSTVPIFPTGSGATVADGSVVWQEAGASFEEVSYSFVAPADAWVTDEGEWIIPVTLNAGDVVVAGFARDTADAHAGSAHLSDLRRTFEEA